MTTMTAQSIGQDHVGPVGSQTGSRLNNVNTAFNRWSSSSLNLSIYFISISMYCFIAIYSFNYISCKLKNGTYLHFENGYFFMFVTGVPVICLKYFRIADTVHLESWQRVAFR